MKRKLYLVDYEENGRDKNRTIELMGTDCLTDSEVVQMLHFYVGKKNRLSSVAEFITDLSLSDFYRICDMPEILTIPHRALYVDMEEMKRVREAAKCMKTN